MLYPAGKRLPMVLLAMAMVSLCLSPLQMLPTYKVFTSSFDETSPSSSVSNTTISSFWRWNKLPMPSFLDHQESVTGAVIFVLLSVQCGAHPILVKLFMPTTVVRSTIIFSQEVVKLVMSVMFLNTQRYTFGCLSPRGLSERLYWRQGIPSILFVVQGYCNLMACQILPPVQYVLLNQTKIISTALCCYIWLGQPQSPLQIMALFLLVIATLLLQKILPTKQCLSWCENEYSYDEDSEQPKKDNKLYVEADDTSHVSDEIDLESNDDKMPQESPRRNHEQKALLALDETGERSSLDKDNGDASSAVGREETDEDDYGFDARTILFMGVLPALLASFLSGLAGTLTQRTLQAQGRNPYLFNVELSVFSIMFILLSLFSPSKSPDGERVRIGSPDFHRIRKEGLIVGWRWHTLIPILSSAVGGVLVGLITKYSGAVVKGFAIICGIIISAVLNQLVLKDAQGHGGLAREEIVGATLGIISLWIHLTNPPTA